MPFWSWDVGASFAHQDVWHNLALDFQWYDFDICMGLSGPGDVYHHNSVSPCLMAQLNDTGHGHSPVHGFALDGYPIFGPYQAKATLAQSCWKARDYSSSQTGCPGGQRTCLLVDNYNYRLGSTTAKHQGPSLSSRVGTMSRNTMSSTSGIYFEDMYYDLECTQQGMLFLVSG